MYGRKGFEGLVVVLGCWGLGALSVYAAHEVLGACIGLLAQDFEFGFLKPCVWDILALPLHALSVKCLKGFLLHLEMGQCGLSFGFICHLRVHASIGLRRAAAPSCMDAFEKRHQSKPDPAL